MEIKYGDCIVYDTLDKVHLTNKGVECCGEPAKMVCHIDGDDFYEYRYKCPCGNMITTRYKRNKPWW